MNSETVQLIPENFVFRKYKCLVLASGGLKGLIQLGILHYLYENKSLSNITKYVATSVGSVICLLLIVGYTPLEILAFMCSHKLQIKSGSSLSNLVSDFGLRSCEEIFETIEQMILEKMEYIPSLSELYDLYQKELHCTTFNLTCQKTEYLSHITYPDLSCIDGLRMSCNIPLIFPKFIYNNCFYIDGAIFDHFPVKFANKLCNEDENILGITVENSSEIVPTDISLVQYIQAIASLTMKKISDVDVKTNNQLIIMTSNVHSNLFISFDDTLAYNYFSLGYNTIKNKFITKKHKQD